MSDRDVIVTVDDGEGPVQFRGGSVDDAPGPFISILDPCPFEAATLAMFDVEGRQYLLVHQDRVVAIEADHDRLGDLLGDSDA